MTDLDAKIPMRTTKTIMTDLDAKTDEVMDLDRQIQEARWALKPTDAVSSLWTMRVAGVDQLDSLKAELVETHLREQVLYGVPVSVGLPGGYASSPELAGWTVLNIGPKWLTIGTITEDSVRQMKLPIKGDHAIWVSGTKIALAELRERLAVVKAAEKGIARVVAQAARELKHAERAKAAVR